MKVIFNLFTNQITGLDRECLPAEQWIRLPFPVNLSKQIEETTGRQVQKTDENGNPLFKTNVQTDEFGIETWDETNDPITVTEYEEIHQVYRVATEETTTEIQPVLQEDGTYQDQEVEVPVYEEIQGMSRHPKTWIENEPIMVDEVISKTYTLEQNPYIFTYDEVIQAKQQSIIDHKDSELVYFTAFDEQVKDIDLVNSQGVNTGNGFISINPSGYALTNEINLSYATNIVEIYSEKQRKDCFRILVSGDGEKFVELDENNQATFESDIHKVVVRFENRDTGRRELYCYGVLI